jgi:hypothetical protein
VTTGLEEALILFDDVLAERRPDAVARRAPGLTPGEFRALEDRLAPWRLPAEIEILYRWSGENHELFGRSLLNPDQFLRAFDFANAVVWLPTLLAADGGYGGHVELGFEERPAKGRLWWVHHGEPCGELLYSSIEHFVRTMTKMIRRGVWSERIGNGSFDDSVHGWDQYPEFYEVRLALADGPVHSRNSDLSETRADIYSTPFNGGRFEFGWPRQWYDLYDAAVAAGATRGLNPFE